MKSFIGLLACAALLVAAAPAPSADFERGYALAREKGCLECHALGWRDVGPSFRAIAQRYRFDHRGRERLPLVIRGGSAGHWGERFVMWPQVQLSDAEVRQLVEWILSQ
ncbi:MAG TPA: c-type cytochrome [Burkholderiales bacterium]|jgi:cytochrome c|nr:c-type cytochrome [Burkholderiales bacterium]